MFLAVLCCTMTFTFGQKYYTDEQIRVGKLVLKNKINNPWVLNPNSIWPGQPLYYQFGDGFDTTVVVNDGDTQEGIMASLIKRHGAVIIDRDTSNSAHRHAVDHYPNHDPGSSFWANLPWGWFFLLLIVLILGTKLLTMVNWKKLRMGKFSDNPTAEGKPFVPGGVNEEDAENHLRALAQRRNPGAEIRITNSRPGYLSTTGVGPVKVDFADKTNQKLRFRNTPAFAGMVSVNGKPAKEEYYFPECGNPVYQRRSLKSGKNLIFSTSPIDFIGDTAIIPVSETPASTASSDSTAPVIPQPTANEIPKSEYLIQTDKVTELAKEVLGKTDTHEVTFEIPKGSDGTFKVTIKPQYPRPGGKEKKEN